MPYIRRDISKSEPQLCDNRALTVTLRRSVANFPNLQYIKNLKVLYAYAKTYGSLLPYSEIIEDL